MSDKTFAVFSDRCNVTFRHADNLTELEAEELAKKLSDETGWWHYAAPTDFNPYDFGDMQDFYDPRMAEVLGGEVCRTEDGEWYFYSHTGTVITKECY